MCVIIPHLIILGIAGEDFSGKVPSWLCIFAGIMHFVYLVNNNKYNISDSFIVYLFEKLSKKKNKIIYVKKILEFAT